MCKSWREYDKDHDRWINHQCARGENVQITGAGGHTCRCRCGAVPEKKGAV
jgi:hypothetical protein